MKTTLSAIPRARCAASALLLCALATSVWAGPSSTRGLVELEVDGLNCALCSEAMKSALKKAAGAKDIEPRLECGRIYLEMDKSASVNESAVNFTLLANGFNLKGTQTSTKSMAEVRASKTC